MANRYNDQDYPRYYDREDRSENRSEYDFNNQNNEQRGRSGSGRENTQGGSADYNRDTNRTQSSGGASTGSQSGYLGSDVGRGYNQQDRDYSDFASSNRSGGEYTAGRGLRSDRGDYTLYGYDRDNRYSDRSGDQGGYGERSQNYQNQTDQNQNFGYSGGGSYARSYESDQQDREHGGSSRYYGDQSGSSSYRQAGQRDNRDQNRQNSGQSYYGQGGSYTGSSESGYDYNRGENRPQNRARNEQEERTFWEKTTDAVASMFGDEEATRRRERDARENDYSGYQNRGNQEMRRGRGPKNYRRSDERIKEDIYDRLTDQYYLDASDIEVEVTNGEVTLTGMVENRQAKRMAEDIAENVSGVTHLENRLRIKGQNQYSSSNQQTGAKDQNNQQNSFSSTNTADSSSTYGSREDLAANYSNQGLTGAATGVTNSSLGDTTSSTGSTNAGVASSTTGLTTGSNPGTMTAAAGSSITGSPAGTTANDASTSATDSSSEAFSERGVDRLSKPAEKSNKK